MLPTTAPPEGEHTGNLLEGKGGEEDEEVGPPKSAPEVVGSAPMKDNDSLLGFPCRAVKGLNSPPGSGWDFVVSGSPMDFRRSPREPELGSPPRLPKISGFLSNHSFVLLPPPLLEGGLPEGSPPFENLGVTLGKAGPGSSVSLPKLPPDSDPGLVPLLVLSTSLSFRAVKGLASPSFVGEEVTVVL